MQSIFLFLPEIYDTLIFDLTKEFSDKSAIIRGIQNESNSVKMAEKLLRLYFKFPIPHVDIIKRIPSEAGLGGGSSDAACFISSIFNIWKLPLEEKLDFMNKAKSLGADCIVFLHKYFLNKRALFLDGTGLDGIIKPIELPELKSKYIVLVNNGTKLSTAKVFAKYNGQNSENSLQEAAVELEPSISFILNDLEKTTPVLCRMSGSGTTCFGIYGSYEEAREATTILLEKYRFVKISEL